jgi:transposase
MDGVVEIITGRERRRRWSVEQKLRVVAEMEEPGVRMRDVSARHGICESLLFQWRRQVRDGVLVAAMEPMFVPVRMSEVSNSSIRATPAEPEPSPTSAPRARTGVIEIELGNGQQVRVGSDVNLHALRRVLTALRG